MFRSLHLLGCASAFVLLLAESLFADEAATAKMLTELGGEVKPAAGPIAQIFFRDCSKLGADQFRAIGELKSLKKLTLYGSCKGLTDETIPLLAKLESLEELGLDGIQVTDAGLKPLAQIKSLKSISMFHPSWGRKDFVGTGLAALAELPQLERLTVAGSPFNDQGMETLDKFPKLKELGTWHTFQTAEGNRHLRGLKELRTLRLGQRLRKYDGKPNPPSLTDETVAILAEMKSLESLTLDEARLSYAALAQLKGLPQLKRLVLERIDISAEEVEKLRGDLPKVKIERKPLTDEQRKQL